MKRKRTPPRKGMNPALIEAANRIRQNKTINVTQEVLLTLVLFVLHDKFGFGGVKKIPRFMAEYEKLLDAHEQGYISLDDLKMVLQKECGVYIGQGGKV